MTECSDECIMYDCSVMVRKYYIAQRILKTYQIHATISSLQIIQITYIPLTSRGPTAHSIVPKYIAHKVPLVRPIDRSCKYFIITICESIRLSLQAHEAPKYKFGTMFTVLASRQVLGESTTPMQQRVEGTYITP